MSLPKHMINTNQHEHSRHEIKSSPLGSRLVVSSSAWTHVQNPTSMLVIPHFGTWTMVYKWVNNFS